MMTELTPPQIDALYAFVSKKGVKPLDVQIELVDHLATDIEARMEENNSVTFDDALEKSSSKFGRWGFDAILQKAEQNVRKRQSRPQYATGRVLAKQLFYRSLRDLGDFLCRTHYNVYVGFD